MLVPESRANRKLPFIHRISTDKRACLSSSRKKSGIRQLKEIDPIPMILSLRSQVAFAESSIRDRIAFAPAPRRNRTEFLMCREKASKVAPLCLTFSFLWSGFGIKIAELGPFLEIFRRTEGNFSAGQTGWRRERDSNPRSGF